MLLEMRGAPAVALTGVGVQKNESEGRGTNDVEKIGHLQACGRGAGTVGSRSCGLGVIVFFESKCPREAAACPSEIQRQIRTERVLVALLLVHSLLAAACALLRAAKA